MGGGGVLSGIKRSSQSKAKMITKQKKDKLPNKVTVIVWKDIISMSDWVGTISEIKEEIEPILCVTVGWIVENTKEKITVADSFTTDYTFGGLTSIPTQCVVSISELDSKSPMKYLC
jgi:hypothetical protein